MTDADDSGLFTQWVATEDAVSLSPTWSCFCGGCGSLAGPGEGAIAPGSYATTPTQSDYLYVSQAQAPLQGSEGNVAALMAGSKWAGVDAGTAKTVITFSFADPTTSTFAYANNDFQKTLSRFSNTDQQMTREMLARIEAVCNVQFVEVRDNATECGVLRYGYSDQPNAMNFAGYAFYPSSAAIGGDIWIGASQAGAAWDFYRPNLVLHETLHAMGLKHPFSTGAVLSADQDIIPNTVMSYSPVAGSSSGLMSLYPSEPMSLDIAALQHLYGASTASSGNTVYNLAAAEYQGGFRAIWDSAGIDTFDASQLGRGVTLDLNQGARSDVGSTVSASGTVGGSAVSVRYTATLSVATGAIIEDAVGSSYADVLIGNGGNNALRGGAGDDRIEGGAGLDTAIFEAGRGSYSIAKTGDGFSVSGHNGSDTLTGVERLTFSDQRIALDLDGNAGMAAKVLGLVFGAPMVGNAGVVGICLTLLDNGMNYEGLMQLALNVRLGGGASNGAVADLLHPTVAGMASRDQLVSFLDNGICSQAGMARFVADLDCHKAQIDLVGLSNTGLAYA